MADVKVYWDKASIHNIGVMHEGEHLTVKLLPGNNIVEEGLWKSVCENPMIKKQAESGLIRFVKFDTKGKEVALDSKAPSIDLGSLKDLNPKDAIEIVKETYNADQIKSWIKLEDRNKVSVELRAQLKLISAQPKKDDKE